MPIHLGVNPEAKCAGRNPQALSLISPSMGAQSRVMEDRSGYLARSALVEAPQDEIFAQRL